ncbi:MAG: hypothetical protein NVS1B11_21240 [Terriglobales bacterium]
MVNFAHIENYCAGIMACYGIENLRFASEAVLNSQQSFNLGRLPSGFLGIYPLRQILFRYGSVAAATLTVSA